MRGLWLFFLSLVLLLTGVGAGWFAAYRAFGWAGFWTGFACCWIVWLLVEVAAAITLYTNAEFTFKGSDKLSHQEASKPEVNRGPNFSFHNRSGAAPFTFSSPKLLGKGKPCASVSFHD